MTEHHNLASPEPHHHEAHEDMARVMETIDHVSEPSTLEHLIQNLRSRLRTISHADQNVPRAGTDTTLPELPPPPPKLRQDLVLNGGHLLRDDTIILLGSCIGMILLGLVLRKVFLYFTHVRETREKYHGGLRQMAEHMHQVTRTISNPIKEEEEEKAEANVDAGPPPTPDPGNLRGDHVVVFKTASSGSTGTGAAPGPHVVVIRTTSNDYSTSPKPSPGELFKPSTHVLLRNKPESEEPYMTQLEARRLSRMHNFLVNYE